MKTALSLSALALLLAAPTATAAPSWFAASIPDRNLAASNLVLSNNGGNPFVHGVASGDPSTEGFVAWTRVSGAEEGNDVPLTLHVWEAQDVQGDAEPEITDTLLSITVAATSVNHHTAKVEVASELIAPGKHYWYRFCLEGDSTTCSRFGRAKTLPVGDVAKASFGVVSCSSLTSGFFHSYNDLAQREDLDGIYHLGDYLYENAGSAILTPSRAHVPANEIVTLADYRGRHGNYRLDKDLQDAAAIHTWITTWDDHETINNSWDPDAEGADGGAASHQDGECTEDGLLGCWENRKGAAAKAYFEYMPISNKNVGVGITGTDWGNFNDPQLWRSFRYGNLAEIVVFDTRVGGRDEQSGANDADASEDLDIDVCSSDYRHFVSDEQETFIIDEFLKAEAEGVTWKVAAQQIMMSTIYTAPGQHFNADAWEGYRYARGRFWDVIQGNDVCRLDGSSTNYDNPDGINNFIVWTGDIHASFANEMADEPLDFPNYNVLGAEFVVTGVTSIGLAGAGTLLNAVNPHMKFGDWTNKGYMVTTFTPDEVQNDFFSVGNPVQIELPQYVTCLAKTFTVNKEEKLTGGLNDMTLIRAPAGDIPFTVVPVCVHPDDPVREREVERHVMRQRLAGLDPNMTPEEALEQFPDLAREVGHVFANESEDLPVASAATSQTSTGSSAAPVHVWGAVAGVAVLAVGAGTVAAHRYRKNAEAYAAQVDEPSSV